MSQFVDGKAASRMTRLRNWASRVGQGRRASPGKPARRWLCGAWPDELAQYTPRASAAACATAGVRQSMSAFGSSADNAATESFNATFKSETLQDRRAFTNERKAQLTTFRWLHRYNTVRRHSRLGQQPPITYEKNTRPAPATLAPAA